MENSAALAKQLSSYDAKRRSSVDLLNEAMGKYGVPELRNRVAGLRTTLTNTESALNAVDPSVTGRTQGSLVTEAQRTKQVANEQAPIAERYGSLSRSLGDATASLSDQERAAQMLAQGQLNDYESGRQALAGRYDLALGREAEQRRRLEADRAYQLQERQARQAERTYQLQTRQQAQQQTAPKGKVATMQQRADKGFSFTDAAGQRISAAQFAASKGIPFRTLLQEMATAGDTGAKQALSFVGNDFGYNPTKLNSQALANIYNSLVKGTGRSATYRAPAPSVHKQVVNKAKSIQKSVARNASTGFVTQPSTSTLKAALANARSQY